MALTLWVGGLWSIGYIVAPTLFSALADRQLAGAVAGRLFALISWIGIGCASYMLLYLLLRQGASALRSSLFWLPLLMLLLTLIGHFGVQPIIAQIKAEGLPLDAVENAVDAVRKSRFATWHGIASVLYLIQSLIGALLVVVAGRSPR
nr:DUF4149 domain-containing protein [Rhodocyclus tenuis]